MGMIQRITAAVLALCLFASMAFAVGGAGGGWPATTSSASTIATNTTVVLDPGWIDFQVLTMTAPSTITIPQANYPNQALTLQICQNGSGGNTPTIAAIAGLTIVNFNGTPPTFTTTANKCGNIAYYYTSTTTAYVTGWFAGP